MSRFNTGNPLGSNDPRDLDDNAKNMDLAVNSEDAQWIDRFGRPRLPLMEQERQFVTDQARREDEFRDSQDDRDDAFDASQASRELRFNDFIASSGYQFVGDYAPGIEITEYNQLIRDSNGEFWRVSGQVDLPYVTTGAGIPEDDALVPAGDAVLRQDLANPDKGAALVARGLLTAKTFSELLDVPTDFKRSDLSYMVGGSAFEWTGERFAPTTRISVRAFGATGGGDDTAACQAALTYAAAYADGQVSPIRGERPVVVFDNSPTGVYPTTDTLFISSLIDVEMSDTVLYSGPTDRPAVVHGEPGVVTWCPASTYRVARDSAEWRLDPQPRGEETDIGLVLYNFNSSSACYIALAHRFEGGFQAIGDGSGFSYNVINLGYLTDNKVQQWNSARNSGWCNENTWNGGRFGRSPSAVDNRSCTAIRTMSYPSSNSNINANTWMRPSFEALGVGVDGDVPVLDLEHSTSNRFLYFRDEGNGSILAREGVRSWDNYWEQGYSGLIPSLDRIDDAGTPSPTSILKSPPRLQYIDASTSLVWDSGDIVSKACHVEVSRINVAGMQGVTVSNNGDAKGTFSITSGTIHADGVGYPNRALGIFLELPEDQAVPLLIRLTAKGGWASPLVACFDEDFNQLDPATNPGMLRGRQGANPSTSNLIGGSYTLSVVESGTYFFKTQPYVRYIAIYARLQSEETRFQRMQIFTQPIYGTVRAFVSYPELVPGMNIGAAPPTSGNSVLGKFILNSSPEAGTPYGWRCIEAGNPGVWEAVNLGGSA